MLTCAKPAHLNLRYLSLIVKGTLSAPRRDLSFREPRRLKCLGGSGAWFPIQGRGALGRLRWWGALEPRVVMTSYYDVFEVEIGAPVDEPSARGFRLAESRGCVDGKRCKCSLHLVPPGGVGETGATGTATTRRRTGRGMAIDGH